jgi:N-carbamoylputrescine amidase
MNDIRIAAVMFNSPLNQTQRNLERMLAWIKASKKQAVDLICFPELNITGYSSQPVIKEAAETVPGPISRCLEKIARQQRVSILAGMAEKDAHERIFASHLVITPNGIAGLYRKLHIAPPECGIFTPGHKVCLFEIGGVKLGVQLCYDAHFPGLSTRMSIDGADVIFMPHASPRGTPQEKLNSWMRHLTARAFDNSVYVVACNQSGNNRKGLDFPGIALVIDPSGEVVKDSISGKEAMIVADLRADVLAAVRGHRMRYFLPHQRSELYS